ncbi:MAG: 30S ribosomal protein S9, partial [Clostridiales Family XIII bacterium]|nr:30S ribosomal protein S9 [Clostridiales Family XIII bacterium]
GKVIVNKKELENYFKKALLIQESRRPFSITNTEGKFDAIATVKGGGETGQAGAIRHAITRALIKENEEVNRPALKAAGYITRDDRMKERKKYGLKKARRAPQFSKR